MKPIGRALVAALALMATGCGNETFDPASMLPAGLQVQELKGSSDVYPRPGQIVTISYTLKLADGTKIESTLDRGRDLEFRLGRGEVIPGLDNAVASMRVGSHALITIPPEQAYGSTGSPPSVPPNATLVYDLWLSAAR